MVAPTLRRVPRSPGRHVLALLALVAAFAAGCSSAAASGGAPAVALDATQVLVDVRTPEEFAGGHLEGAVNVPVESPDFPTLVASLDPSLEYVVYCRSGRRSEIAAAYMIDQGLTVTDLGAFDAAQRATLLAVVSP